jgi:hypothetical protein
MLWTHSFSPEHTFFHQLEYRDEYTAIASYSVSLAGMLLANDIILQIKTIKTINSILTTPTKHCVFLVQVSHSQWRFYLLTRVQHSVESCVPRVHKYWHPRQGWCQFSGTDRWNTLWEMDWQHIIRHSPGKMWDWVKLTANSRSVEYRGVVIWPRYKDNTVIQ